MVGDVKGKPRRSYHSPRRRQQAAATRQAIVDAAEQLFVADGFAATSVPAIASGAGVSVKTVYLGFGSKAGVLHALWDRRLGGDDDPTPVVERGWYRRLLAEPDPERLLQLLAAQSAAVKARAGGVMEVVRDAASADPDVADLWARIQGEFRQVLAPVAQRLHEGGDLAPGVDPATATDILWTLNHPDVWRLLSTGCGWSPERYERWLAATFCAQLLARRG